MAETTGPGRVAVPEREIVRRLADGGPTIVALSGGVDSGLVAAIAVDALGADAAAVTVVGSAVADDERRAARELAEAVGISHTTVVADPVERPEYRENRADRCYHCRSVETSAIVAWGRSHRFRRFVDGVHADDLADDRPGLRAMDRAGFLHPLLVAGWGKAEIRAAARRRGLPNADRPSNACLASRVAHGTPISEELLGRIERAEAEIAAHGFRRVRVRVRGSGARIEVDPAEIARLSAEPLASEVRARLRSLGFSAVEIDLAGYGGARRALPMIP